MRPLFNARLTLLAAMVAAVTVSSTSAAAATVTVRNLGQAGMVSTVPQAPATITSRGSCGDARTVEEANGEPSTCPAGTWPVQGDPSWGAPTVDAIGGDTLELTFSPAPDFVIVNLTTVFPIGLRTPPCPTSPTGPVPCANGDVAVLNTGATLIAAATPGKPAVFALKLTSPLPGAQVAITTAGPADAASNYSLGLASPRWDDASAKCGLAFFAPADSRTSCPSKDVKGGPPQTGSQGPAADSPTTTPADPTAALSLKVAKSPVLRGSKLRLVTTTSAAGKLVVALRRSGKTVIRRTTDLSAGKSTVAFTLTRAQRRLLAKHPGRSYALVTKLTDAAGRSVTTSATVKWRAP